MKFPKPESKQFEFKRELPKSDQIIKTIIGFCNQSGGKLIIGIQDDGTIAGFPKEEIEHTIDTLKRAIFDASAPSIHPQFSTQNFEGKHVIIIQVSEGNNKPYYRRKEGLEKGTYIRLGKRTVRATAEMIEELKWHARGVGFESLPAYTSTHEDIDLSAFKAFLKKRTNHGQADDLDTSLYAYRILVDENARTYATTLGILLFGHHPQTYFSEATLLCTHFRGTDGREALATLDCEGTLFGQLEQAHNFLLERLHPSFTINALERKQILEVPKVAIREALLNMLVHRNYHLKSPSKIALYDDRIEFFSPGQFPGPLNPKNLTTGLSYLRNPLLCKVMRESGLIEKLGTGFIEIFKSYERRKLHSPMVIEGENFVKVVLPRYARSLKREQAESDDTEKLMQLFAAQTEVKVSDVVHHLSVSRSTALRRLNQVLEAGLISRTGHKKGVVYRKRK